MGKMPAVMFNFLRMGSNLASLIFSVQLLYPTGGKTQEGWRRFGKCDEKEGVLVTTAQCPYSTTGGMNRSSASRSLGWRMTKWMAGAFPLDTMAH